MTSMAKRTIPRTQEGRMAQREPNQGSILVVDDEPGVLLTIQAILAQEGYAVDSAANGKAALTKLRAKTYDLVLTDLRLGDIDGLEVLAELRKLTSRTVAIVLTGYASLESAIQAMREGAYDYLVKPTDVEELKLRVAHVFERHRLTDELARRIHELEIANATIDRMNANLRQEIDEATAQLRAHVANLDATKSALEAAQAQKERFTAMVAHELRAPLAPIKIGAQLIARQPNIAANVRSYTATIEEHVTRLERLITDLLDVTRIDTGTFSIRVSACNLKQLTADMVREYSITHTDRHFVLNVPDLALIGDYDRGRIEQAFGNLLGNAVKYSFPGTTITTSLMLMDDGWAELSVEDEGMGIPKDKVHEIFDPFKRLQGTEEIKGYGLGLYITKGIAEAHGGTLTVESREQRKHGAVFTIALPGATESHTTTDDSTRSQQ